MAATTFDPAKKAAAATLSNGNLTVTTASAAYAAALSTNALPPGRGYFEVTVNSMGGTGALAVGIAQATTSLTNIAGNDAVSTGFSAFDGNYRWNSTAYAPTMGTTIAGTVFSIAYDTLHNNVWIRGANGAWQGTGGGDPAAATGGAFMGANWAQVGNSGFYALFETAFYAEVAVYNNSQVTANFGATGFSGTVPSGYSSVDALVAAGTPAGTANNPHRYWRLHDTADGGTNSGFAELALATASGGTNLLTSSSFVGASQLYDYTATYAPPKAVDGNPATFYASYTGAPVWYWIDLGAAAPAAVREVKMTAQTGSGYALTFGTFDLQWSDDTTAWHTATTFTAGAWSAGQQQTFLWSAPVFGGSAAQARVLMLA